MWSQKIAKDLIKKNRPKADQPRAGKKIYNITTGISPSGPFHIGHLREVLTSDIVAWSIKNLKRKVQIHFILDDFDHLRKVYPFLEPRFEKYVGKPLYLIPSPGKNQSYSEYFSIPFLKVLKNLGLDFKIYKAHELYQKGLFNQYIEICLEKRKEIADILKKVAGTKVAKDFYPFRPLCPKCQSLTKTKILGVDTNKKEMAISCECGFRGKINYLNGGGKLIWRLHWPAWWQVFRTDAEAYGKEHGTVGGSYDTGKEIVEKIFKKKAPLGIPYDLIYLKGFKGKMSSSLGNLITADLLVKTLPNELVKYFILRVLPQKPIFFDPKDAIRFSEEIAADLKRLNHKKLSPEKILLLQYIFQTKDLKKAKIIPWEYFLLIIQLAKNDPKEVEKLLKKSDHFLSTKTIKNLVPKAENWLKEFASDDLILKVNSRPSKIKLEAKEKIFLTNLSNKLKKKTYSSEELQNLIFDLIKQSKLPSQQGFSLIYRLTINKNSGPKAGLLINLIGQKQFINLIEPSIK